MIIRRSSDALRLWPVGALPRKCVVTSVSNTQIDATRAAFDLAGQLCDEKDHLVSCSDWRRCHGASDRYIGGVQKAIQAALEGRLDPFSLMSHSVSMCSLDRGFELTRDRPEGFVKARLLHTRVRTATNGTESLQLTMPPATAQQDTDQ